MKIALLLLLFFQGQAVLWSQNTPNTNQRIFHVIDEMPAFPGCENKKDHRALKKCSDAKMLQFIYQNRRDLKTKGMVLVEFIVEEDGSITNAQVKKSLSPECDQEALRIVGLMPKWNPGKLNNEPKRTKFNLPVRF